MNEPVPFEYLLSGRDVRGRRRTEIVLAQTADDAVRAFEERGYADVTLHTDDVVAPLFKPSSIGKHFRPHECVRLRTAGPIGYVTILALAMYRRSWAVVLALVAFAAVCRLTVPGWETWDLVIVSCALLPLWLALFLCLTSPFRKDRRILKAAGWARWQEVLDLIGQVDRKAQNPFLLRQRKAQALAGLGWLAEALAEFDRVTELPDIPDYLYWVGQGAIYMAAREPEKVLAVFDRARELAPTATLPQIDYANKLLVFRRDMRQARAVLACARKHAIADTAAPWLLATEGLLALEEKQPAEAVERLGAALRQMTAFVRGNPAGIVLAARIRAWLCLAYAELGDTATARRHLNRAMPLLRAHQEYDLLRQCEQAAG